MTISRSSLGKRNKRMGSNAERYYAKVFRDLGMSFCKTSRQASRIHDDVGIDLVHTDPFNIQIKAGLQRGMNPSQVLSDIREKVAIMLPPSDNAHRNMNILIHKKPGSKGKKRNEFDDLVMMSFDDFKKLIDNGNRKTEIS